MPPPGAPFTVQQDIDLAKWAHLSTILYWLPPLIIWLVGKDRGPRTNGEGKEALNFGITATIFVIAVQIVFFWILGWIPFAGIVFGIIGWLAHLAIWVFVIIWAIQGYQTVQAGGAYRTASTSASSSSSIGRGGGPAGSRPLCVPGPARRLPDELPDDEVREQPSAEREHEPAADRRRAVDETLSDEPGHRTAPSRIEAVDGVAVDDARP